eukprot:5595984-Alexandrium_andersonii.AAC.1
MPHRRSLSSDPAVEGTEARTPAQIHALRIAEVAGAIGAKATPRAKPKPTAAPRVDPPAEEAAEAELDTET